MSRDAASTWDALGRRDPHWAILSEPGRQGQWDDESFFATGRAEIDATLAMLEGVLLHRAAALDFGCGLGRLSQALAVHFESVTGVDVAQSMIDGAVARNPLPERIHFVVNTASTLPFDDATFDFAYSNLVLQHVPPPGAAGYIAELVRVLRPGGIAVFQELSHRSPSPRNTLRSVVPGGVRVLVRRLRYGWAAPMTMDGIARQQVIALLEVAGGEVVDVQPDGAGEPVWKGYRYTIRRLSSGDAQ